MDLGKRASQLGMVFDPWLKFQWILAVVMWICSCFTVSVVPFIRRDFGERYLSWINLFFGYTIVANFAFLGGLIGVSRSSSSPWAMTLFWLAFVALSIYHRYEISRKNREGREWHSYYMGTSLVPIPTSAEVIALWIEPAMTLAAGLLIWKIASGVGLWLVISAFSLLLNNHLIYYYQRQRILDLRDAQIESRNMGKALAGRPAVETGGFVIAESNRQMIRKDSGLRAAFEALGDDLRAVIDGSPTWDGNSAKGVA